MMSSNQPDCLTSLVSYVPELNFDFNLPSIAAAVSQLGISTTNEALSVQFLFPAANLLIIISWQNISVNWT